METELELALIIIGLILVLGFGAILGQIGKLDNKIQTYISARSHRRFLEDEDKRIEEEMKQRRKQSKREQEEWRNEENQKEIKRTMKEVEERKKEREKKERVK